MFHNAQDKKMSLIPSIDPSKVILAHMSKDEVKDLSRAQGGYEVNEYLNIPQFFRLGELLQIDGVKDKVRLAFDGYKQSPIADRKRIRNEIDGINEKDMGRELPLPVDSKNSSPEISELADNGVQGDTQIVALSPEVYDFFKDTLGKVDLNNEDGLPQFGLGSFLCSLVGGVLGSLVLPGVGTAIGAGVGNLGGSYVEDWIDPNNENKDKSFLERMPGALMSGGLGYLGAKGLDGFKSDGFSGALSSMGGSLEKFAPYAIPAMQFAGLADEQYRKNRDQSKYGSEMEDYLAQRHGIMNQLHNQFTGLRDYKTGQLLSEKETPQEKKKMKFSRGGSAFPKHEIDLEIENLDTPHDSFFAEGETGGQQDNVHVDLPHGSFVLDANTVSAVGDGNSIAGRNKIREMLNRLNVGIGEITNQTKLVPAAISSGEFTIYPHHVSALGDGDLKAGHKKLKSFVKNLRKDKKMNVLDIPPEAKDLSIYLGRA
jgi:hypothetical protein